MCIRDSVWTYRLLGVGLSALLTALLTSSGAMIGLCFALVKAGVFTEFHQVAVVVLGAHIGTCIVPIMAALPMRIGAWRVAIGHLLFNLANVALVGGLAWKWLPQATASRAAAAAISAAMLAAFPFAGEVSFWLVGRFDLLAALFALSRAVGVDALPSRLSTPHLLPHSSASLLPSTAAATRHSSRASRLSYLAAVAAPMLLALPLSQPAPWAPFGEVNTLRMSQNENSGRWLGTTSTADYVPVTVEMLPPRRLQMVDAIAQGLPPDRVNYEAMPDGAVGVTETVRPLRTRYHVTGPKQFRLRRYQFDFPGWQVIIDGEPADTELAAPEGTIVILVPQGEHVPVNRAQRRHLRLVQLL